MSDDTNTNPLDFLKDLSFAPGWAKEPPKEQTLAQFSGDDERRDGRGPRRPFRDGDRGPRREGGERPPRRDGDRPSFRDRPRREDGERPSFRDRPPRENRDGDRAPRREGDERPFRGDRGPRREGGEGQGRPGFRGPFREPRVDVSTLPVEVKFLPDQKEMGVVIRKVQGGHRAYPIRDLARLFLAHPSSCDVRIEVKADQTDLFLHQCTRCGFVTTDPEALRAHMLEKHFDEEFTKETIEGEAPSGAFSCVAKCGLSGRLIGPPNHHSFAQRLRDVLHEVAPGMPEDVYRRKLEMVHDEAAIQQWKDEAKIRTVYRRVVAAEAAATPAPSQAPASGLPNGETEAAPVESPVETPVEAEAPSQATVSGHPAEEPMLDRAMAEAVFAHDIVPTCTTSRKRVSCPFDKAQEIRDPKIAPVVREAWRQEQRSPFSLFIALRGAFRAKKFHLFRVLDGRGMEFVIPKAPTALDVTHAVPELVKVMDYVREHKGCTRGELFAALGVPVEGERNADQDRIYQQYAWIVESAHLIEYFNGVLALPEEHPYFKATPQAAASGHPAPEAEASGHPADSAPEASAEAKAAPEASAATESPEKAE